MRPASTAHSPKSRNGKSFRRQKHNGAKLFKSVCPVYGVCARCLSKLLNLPNFTGTDAEFKLLTNAHAFGIFNFSATRHTYPKAIHHDPPPLLPFLLLVPSCRKVNEIQVSRVRCVSFELVFHLTSLPIHLISIKLVIRCRHSRLHSSHTGPLTRTQ